jgi:hypothetical protein
MTRRAKDWEELVGAWEASGLSQAEFCRRRGVKEVTFGWWKRKLRPTVQRSGGRVGDGARSPRRTEQARFVELAVPKSAFAVGAFAYEIALRSGRVIRLGRDFDPSVVGELIMVAESC